MDIETLLKNDVQEFIHGHKSVDIKELALMKMPFPPDIRNQILQQIKSQQKAQHKLQKWATRKRIIFPNPDLVEQSSSDKTAAYKASIYPQTDYPHEMFIDLTAGLGSDALAFSEKFTTGLFIEADPEHASLLEYNLNILSDKKIDILNGYAEDLIENLPKADLIYIDPQRRNDAGRRGIYDFSQMMPNILELLPGLKEKSPCILIKTSPFLDIHEALRQLGTVREIHVVEAEGQCKEVLYFIDQKAQASGTDLIVANCDNNTYFKGKVGEENKDTELSEPQTYLFEPGPALMKSGLHSTYARQAGLNKIASMTHLYTANTPIPNKLGRSFEVLDTIAVKKKEVMKYLPDMRASISVRNFPMKPEELRKKLGIKDGGEYTVFGATLQNKEKRLILCKAQTH